MLHYIYYCKNNRFTLSSSVKQNIKNPICQITLKNVTTHVMFSPVILRLKIADRDKSSSTANSELVLQRWPLDEGGRSVDPEDDQCGLPYSFFLRPHIGISVCSTSHYTVTFGSPVNT